MSHYNRPYCPPPGPSSPSSFPLPSPVLQAIGEDEYILKEKYILDFFVGRTHYRLVSLPGATFDGLSKPKLVQALPVLGFLIGGKLRPREVPGGWAHDQLYQGEFLPRQDCDTAFLWLEKKNEVCWIRRRIYYRAVRIGGGAVWENHTPESIAYARQHNRLYRKIGPYWLPLNDDLPERNINN